MNTTAISHLAPTNMPIPISGPPLLAKVGAAIAAAVAAISLVAWPNIEAITATVSGVTVAWRLLQLAIIVEGDELVLRNLFATRRIKLANVDVRRSVSDLRTRAAWGGQILPKGSIPKMADDNMQTHATLIRIVDLSNNERSTHTDCSLGIRRQTQDQLFTTLQATIAG